MIRERLLRVSALTRSGLVTLILHGGILYLVIFGVSIHQEKLEAKGKPVQAVVISQQELDRKEAEKKRRLKQVERQRKEEAQRLAEEERRKKEEALKKEQVRKRREFLLNNCEKLVLEEEQSGTINHELDGLCDKEREALKKLRIEQERERAAAEQKRQAEAEKKRKAEEEKQQKIAAEKKRKQEEEKRRKAEAEKKRKAEAEKQQKIAAEKKRKQEEERQRKAEAEQKRKAEEARRLEEQELKAQLKLEQESRLAAATQKAATDALSAAAGRIRSAIENNWRRPGMSLGGLKVTIGLQVGRNGEVLNARIVKSSGDVRFDESAALAVQKASPLPIPKESEYYQYIKEFHIEFNPDE